VCSSDLKIEHNRFVIRTNLAGVEVSWQVTGIRKDPWAEHNRIQVEVDKPAEEQGLYLHPEVYDQPEDKGVSWSMTRSLRELTSKPREDGATAAR